MHHLLDIHLFIRGLLIGFIIAAPVGPVGILCLRRTFHYGRLSGLVSGLGAVTIDMIYATIAIFGLTFVADFVVFYGNSIHIFGVLLLLFIGWKIFFSQSHAKNIALDHRGLLHDYVSTLWLTIAQPGALLTLFGIFSSIAPRVAGHPRAAVVVLIGTALWGFFAWFLVTHVAAHFHRKIGAESFMHWVNKIAGVLIWIFALLLLLDLFLHLK